MNYDELDVDRIVDEVVQAEEQGRTRPATIKENMVVRLAALSALVRQMQINGVLFDYSDDERTVYCKAFIGKKGEKNIH